MSFISRLLSRMDSAARPRVTDGEISEKEVILTGRRAWLARLAGGEFKKEVKYHHGFFADGFILFDSLEWYIEVDGAYKPLYNYIKSWTEEPNTITENYSVSNLELEITSFVSEEQPRVAFMLDVKGAEQPVKLKLKAGINLREWRVMLDNFLEPFIGRVQFTLPRFKYQVKDNTLKLASKNVSAFALSDMGFSAHKDKREIDLEFLIENDSRFSVVLGRADEKRPGTSSLEISNLESELSEKRQTYENIMNQGTLITTPDENLNSAFRWAKVAARKLTHNSEKIGKGTFAGLPKFPSYFLRDTVWSCYGLACIDSRTACEILENLARFQAENSYYSLNNGFHVIKGQIPHRINMDGSVNFMSADVLLFISAVLHAFTMSNNKEFLKKVYPSVKSMIDDWYMSVKDSDGLIPHFPDFALSSGPGLDKTWMDVSYRGPKALDVQVILYKGLRDASTLARLVRSSDNIPEWKNDDSARWNKMADDVRKTVNDKYWSEQGFYFDSILDYKKFSRGKRPVKSCAPLFALWSDIARGKEDKILDMLSSPDFCTEWGIRSLSSDDPGFSDKGKSSYHHGAVWDWISFLTAGMAFKYNNTKFGEKLLDLFGKHTGIWCIGALPEVYMEESIPYECSMQAWSSLMGVYAVVHGLFGIGACASKNTLHIEPRLPEKWPEMRLENLSVADNVFDIEVTRKDNSQIIRVYSHEKEDARPFLVGRRERKKKLLVPGRDCVISR